MARSFVGSSRQEQISKNGLSNAIGVVAKYKLLVVGGLGITVLFLLISQVGKTKAEPISTVQGDEVLKLAEPVSTTNIDKSFSVPIRDSQGGEVSQLVFRIEDAVTRNDIIVKGQRAETVEGRVFMILNLKIDNTYGQGVDIKTADYFRLSVNGNQEEWFAPSIHNDLVTVPPISTKVSRVGFPINEDDTDLTLQVGDVEGEKEVFTLDFN